MKRGIYLAALGVVLLGAVIVTTVGAQVYPVRLDPQEPQLAAPTPPSLVLADGGIEFPDGSVQTTASQVTLIGSALVPVTGQTTSYTTGDDGDLQRGIVWPNPRFTINESSPGVADGTVTDHLTGLIWLQRANCFTTQTWEDALAKANTLFDGCTDCGNGGDCFLSDGSIAGQWRLPSVRELHSLVHYGFYDPPLSNTAGTGQWVNGDPFFSVQSASYWSSTTSANTTVFAWGVIMGSGSVNLGTKTLFKVVWPVRGGQ